MLLCVRQLFLFDVKTSNHVVSEYFNGLWEWIDSSKVKGWGRKNEFQILPNMQNLPGQTLFWGL